jgi:plastocyanin
MRSSCVAWCGVALGLFGLAVPARAGTVAGRVELIEKGGRRANDLSDVVVYIEGTSAKIRLGKQPAARIVMKGKAFTPHLVVVPVGSSVEFPNQDPIFHNAFSVSGANRFDLSLYKKPKAGSWTFEHPGIVRVYCNIHPQMSAVVVVRDNPYYTQASQDGAFVIQGVPGGRYVLSAWHERVPQAASAEVTVPAEGRVEGQLTLDASNYKREPHLNKFGKPYPAGERY